MHERYLHIFFLILFAFALRLVFLEKFQLNENLYTEDDSITYLAPSQSYNSSQEFLDHNDKPMSVRTPGYPYFLYTLFNLFSEKISNISYAQILLNSFLIIPIYSIAANLFNRNAGIFAGILFASEHNQIYYSLVVLSESLFTFFLVFFVFSVLKIFSEKRIFLWAFISGLLLLLATMVRPISYYLICLIPIFYLFNSKRKIHINLLVISLILTPTIIGAELWKERNLQEIGTRVVSTIEGHNLLDYRAIPSYAEKYEISYAESNKYHYEKLKGINPDSGEFYQAQKEIALQSISSNLLAYIKFSLKKMFNLVFGFGENAAKRIFTPDSDNYPSFVFSIIDSIDNKSITNWLFNFDSYKGFMLFIMFYFALHTSFSFFGIFQYLKKPKKDALLLLTIVAYFLVISSGLEAYSRFRVPIDPILFIFAGIGAAKIVDNIRTYLPLKRQKKS